MSRVGKEGGLVEGIGRCIEANDERKSKLESHGDGDGMLLIVYIPARMFLLCS
jgi:hypothetical protein